jgi:hypothetical protein
VTPPQPVDFARLASRSHILFNPATPEAVLTSDFAVVEKDRAFRANRF